MLALWAGLLAWSRWAPEVGCPLAALVLAPLWALLMRSGSELVLVRRASFIRHYLMPGGRLARWLRRRVLLLGWQSLKALVLALVLLVGVLSLSALQWLVLGLDLLLFLTLVFVTDWLLEGELNPALHEVMVRHWTHRLNALLLWLALTATLYFSPHADYQGMGPAAVVRMSVIGVSLGCDALAVLGRAAAASEGLLWWAAERLFGGLHDPGELLAAWVGFLAAFGVSFLLAWAYSRGLTGILSRPWGGREGAPEAR